MNAGINSDDKPEMGKQQEPPILKEMQPTTVNEVASVPAGTPTVVAPVLVIPSSNTGTSVGKDVDTGNDFVGRDQSTESGQRYSSTGSNVSFNNSDNSKLWEANMALLQKISDVAFKLNGIPDDVAALTKYIQSLPVPPPVTVPVTIPVAIPIAPVITAPISPGQSWLLIIAVNLIVLLGGAVVWLLLAR